MKPKALKNKDGIITSYQFRVYIGRDTNNKQIYATKTWRPNKTYTQKQLEKELMKQQIIFEDEVKAGYSKDGNISFKAFSQKWIDEYAVPNCKKKTVAGYRPLLKKINLAIGHIPLNNLTPEVINSFLNNLREIGTNKQDKTKGLSDKSIKNYHSLLSSILSIAVEWHYLKDNVVKSVTTPKVREQKDVQPLSKNEVEKLFQLLEEEPLKYQVFIKLAVYSGMRNGEMVGLQWGDIDFKNCLIHVNKALLYTPQDGTFIDTTKTKKSKRVIKISKLFFELLNQYKLEQDLVKKKLGDKWQENDFVFTQWNGKPMYPKTPYEWFIKFQKKNNLRHCSIHELRHTTATLLIMNGINEKLVSGRLGHSNTGTTTNIYASYINAADEIVSDALDNVLIFEQNSNPLKKRYKIVRSPKSNS